jgi:hypothetical protein
VDKGPWKLCARSDGKLCVASDDFEHDVQLIISGDFADEFQRADYAAWLAKTLNKGADQPDAPECRCASYCHLAIGGKFGSEVKCRGLPGVRDAQSVAGMVDSGPSHEGSVPAAVRAPDQPDAVMAVSLTCTVCGAQTHLVSGTANWADPAVAFGWTFNTDRHWRCPRCSVQPQDGKCTCDVNPWCPFHGELGMSTDQQSSAPK